MEKGGYIFCRAQQFRLICFFVFLKRKPDTVV